ncbi:ATP-binding cassette domain-containing protein [Streptomyces lunaelactis]|uniref:ATP-binding cassette domain-containing protein n=1 Tax=Streptomyces lunaelactis TaxID=1535768 RepID=UPI001C2FE5C2|nr:ATP-binding cassette domain-containing protein [Streptomyces lunaelactis]
MTAETATPHAPPQAESAVLRCTDLVRRFGERTAVDGVSFSVAPGETYGLLGPNGAGKTTTIRLVRTAAARRRHRPGTRYGRAGPPVPSG